MENENKPQEFDSVDQPEEAKKSNIGGVAIVTVAVAALLFVIWLIISIWTFSDEDEVVVPPEPAAAVDVEDEEETSSLSIVPDRDPEALGLRINGTVGRLFTLPENGQTLYFNKAGDCLDECLEDWTPYLAPETIEAESSLGTVVRSDTGEAQYAWEGNALYTYNEDTDRSFLGDGHSGTWRIARP